MLRARGGSLDLSDEIFSCQLEPRTWSLGQTLVCTVALGCKLSGGTGFDTRVGVFGGERGEKGRERSARLAPRNFDTRVLGLNSVVERRKLAQSIFGLSRFRWYRCWKEKRGFGGVRDNS